MTYNNGDLFLATVAARDSNYDVSLRFDGETEATTKYFKTLNAQSITTGSRVLVLKISGTYLVLGKVALR